MKIELTPDEINFVCSKCGENNNFVILTKGQARKLGYNDTGSFICYGQCNACQSLYMIHIPTKKYHLLTRKK